MCMCGGWGTLISPCCPHCCPPCCLQELCEGGDWFDRLLNGGSYSERHAAEAARALLETVSYCHSLGVVHRFVEGRGGLRRGGALSILPFSWGGAQVRAGVGEGDRGRVGFIQ